ncbi:MAG: Rnase Y domain-containing protein, partial [Bacteroidota bacterium]
MVTITTVIIICIIGLIVGLAIGYFMATTVLKKGIESKSAQILKDAEAEAEVVKKDKILQAKEKFLQLKAEHEAYINEKNQTLQIG